MFSPPIELLEPLAAGGMGEVWRGRHRRSGRAVAVKVLTGEEARRPEAQERFRAEARVAAALDHPNIALVLDYGLLPGAWVQQSGGALALGSPYLVSEQARGGDLRRWVRRPPPWANLRAALLGLLDALAFAHARGVIHRDLKPGNVLLGTRREERHGVLLADFGVAHRLGELPEPGFHAHAGTPTFMAPEQIAGDWRAYGPWTDLYGLGVLAWTIVQGEAPGRASAGAQTAWERPRIIVPEGLPGWLSRLLRADPAERFRRAADAATALRALPDAGPPLEEWSHELAEEEGEPSWRTPGQFADTTAHHHLGVASNQTLLLEAVDAHPLIPDVEPAPLARAALPEDWRPPVTPAPPLALVDLGLSLWGLRERALVGRERERDQLWARALSASQEGGAQIVLVSGPLGCGKTRLLRWLCERAEETGLALALHGHLGEGAGAGLQTLLRRALRADGLPERALPAHLERSPFTAGLQPEDRRALLSALGASGGPARGALSAGERLGVLVRALRRIAGSRALILALDDATEDPDGLDLALHLLRQEAPGPVILALAAREDRLAASPEGARWAALAAEPAALSLNLGPLPPEDWPALVDAGLPLTPALRERVAARAAGSPLFAELLVGAWVRAGALEIGPDGFRLAEGSPDSLPEGLADLAREQLEALLSSRPAEDALCLELAATLGLEVDLDEWRHACAAAGLHPGLDLLDAALALTLLRADPGERSVSFAQSLLREALLARAAAEGRERAHHRAAAAALADGAGSWERQGRLGRHLLLSGAEAEAVEPLLRAAMSASLNGRHAEERALLDLAERALPALPPDQQDQAEARLHTLRGHVLQFGHGDRALARQSFARALEAAERAGRRDLAVDIRRRLAGATYELGDLPRGEALLRQTLEEAQELGEPYAISLTALDLTSVLRMQGKRAEGEQTGRLSRRVAQEHGIEDLCAINSKHSWYLETLPDDDARMEALRSATLELRRLGMQGHRANALNNLGVLLRKHERVDEAVATYRASLAIYEEIGASYASLPRYNLACVHLSAGRVWDAYPGLKRCLHEVQTWRWVGLEPMVRSALAEIEVHTGDLAAFDDHLARIRALWSAGGVPERDAAGNLERAATAARALGRPEQSVAALTLAAELYEAARAPEAAARARELLTIS